MSTRSFGGVWRLLHSAAVGVLQQELGFQRRNAVSVLTVKPSNTHRGCLSAHAQISENLGVAKGWATWQLA